MATTIGFHVLPQSEFEDFVATDALVKGTFYCTPNLLHLARSKNMYFTYGGSSVQDIVKATNSAFGIVKGQPNDTPETWHNVSANNGLLSINRTLLEALIDQKIAENGCSGGGTELTKELILAILNRITLVGPDGKVIAKNSGNGKLVVQRANPNPFGIVKCCHSCCCWQNAYTLEMESIDAMLIADVENNQDIQYPMQFVQELPDQSELPGRLTLIPNPEN
jgi:hypothetical protein